MTVIDDSGVVVTGNEVFIEPAEIDDSADGLCVNCPNDTIPESLITALQRVAVIRVAFPFTDDGRGFSIARTLRQHGYRQRLRATGRLISDQYSFAIACGFDEFEIAEDILQRQPLSTWRGKRSPGYRDKLRGLAVA